MSVIYIQLDGAMLDFVKMAAPSDARLCARQTCKPYSIVDSGPNLVLLEESEPNGPFIDLTL